MEQASGQSQAPRAQNPGHRDMMFCHECHDEWYRDEHGLTCPECHSDFTEIIEDGNDPRDAALAAEFEHDHDHMTDGDDDDMPDLEDAPHAHHFHPAHLNPFAGQGHDDPEEGDISGLQFRQLGPGRFAVTGTMYRAVSPSGQARNGGGAGNVAPGAIGGFASLLSNILGGGPGRPPPMEYGDHQNQGAEGQNSSEAGSGTTPGGHRFTYTAGARLYPRDADNPGPHMGPVDELNNVLVGLMASFGAPPQDHHGQFPGIPADHNPHIHPINPLMHLFGQMMTGGNGQVGDAVYSQEALDRIITQLMEHNSSSNAPGPAPQSEIESLPRKEVSIEMLGPEGRAECSICMEEVNIGEEVAELPCHHWFHHPCIAAWLGEHDTCPHCRKGISKEPPNSGNSSNPPGSGANPRPMPGAFGGDDNAPADDANAGHGLGERLRRGLFGPR